LVFWLISINIQISLEPNEKFNSEEIIVAIQLHNNN
jgi:hypothetical protein